MHKIQDEDEMTEKSMWEIQDPPSKPEYYWKIIIADNLEVYIADRKFPSPWKRFWMKFFLGWECKKLP